MTITVYRSTIKTVDPDNPNAEAVAVEGDRIVAVGSYADVAAAAGDHVVDDRFADNVLVPGLIDQHLHPVLGASALSTEVIATEDWVLPDVTYRAAYSHEEYLERLAAAEAELDDPDEWLFSWGYHQLWHGELDRDILDTISTSRPIGVWQRSCHEFFVNSAAIDALGVTAEQVADAGELAATIDLPRGRFWERGFMTFLLGRISPVFLTADRLVSGLEQVVTYLHQNGVTAINEPGAQLQPGLWDLYQAILGDDATPFSSTFLVDARGPADFGVPVDEALASARQLIDEHNEGKVRFLPGQVKLFADGAIISQLMQMREPYLDAEMKPNPHHHGEWLMEPDVFEERAKAYWDAGYQLHVHVNGDAGLDLVLDTLERRLDENPRDDHRTVIVHFANSVPEQVDRIARLGAIVSSNPYYPVGFADKYSEWGLGPERADVMARNRSVIDRGVPLSFHSDLPMGRSDPIGMMHCGVNRITQSGRIAGPEERIDAEAALRAVTIEAAYSWRREHELGSIEVGKFATFTVLDADPLAVDPLTIDEIDVLGVVFEGRWMPVPDGLSRTGQSTPRASVTRLPGHDHHEHGCACEVAATIVEHLRSA
ncbi:MAG: amidohydrolase [Ilumatobacteraceae bacterium]|nr:amidohydrolase [Ilumatobacteraceae bacterium]